MSKKSTKKIFDYPSDEFFYSFIDESGFALWSYRVNEKYTKGESKDKLINALINATLIDCNKTYLEFHNLKSKNDAIGKSLKELSIISNENYSKYIDNFIKNDYRTRDLIIEEKLSNGSSKAIEISAVAHFDKENKFTALTGSFIDRTELFNIKKELDNTNFILDEQNKILTDKIEEIEDLKDQYFEEHEIYKSLFHESPSPKFIINPINYKILEINQAALELFEVDRNFNLRLLDLIDSSNYITLKDYLQGHNGDNRTTYKGFTKSTKKELFIRILSKRINYKDKSALLLHIIDLTDQFIANEKEIELKTKINSIRDNLLVTQSKYKMLIDESPYGVVIHQDNKIVYVNRIALNLLSVNSENELIGKNIFDYYHDEYKEFAKERAMLVLESNEHTEQIREKLKTSKGNEFFAETIVFPTEFQGKKAVQFLFNDVTEQINYQKDLIDSEERYRILFDSSKDSLIITDLEGNISDLNQSAIEKFNYTKKQIQVFNLYNLLVKDTFSFVEDPFIKIQSEDSFEGKCFGIDSYGDEFIASVTFKKIEINSEPRLFISIRDITIEENAKNKIKESRREANDIIENLTIPVSISDFDDGSLIYYSQKFKEIFGERIKNPEFTSFELYKDPDDAKHLRSLFANSNKISNFEVELIDKNRKIIVGLLSTTKISFRGKNALLSSFLDITERKKYERDLKNKDRLLENLSDISKIGGWEYIIADDNLIWTKQCYLIHNMKNGDSITLEDAINYYHPDDREIINNYFQDLINYGKAFELEVRIRPIDSEYIWVRVIGNSNEENGVMNRVSGTIQDINQRKQTEIQLKDYSYSLSLAAKAANFGIWDWNIANNRMNWDTKMWEIFELDERKIKDIHFWKKYTYLDDWLKIRNKMINSFKKIEEFETEFRIITKSKKLKYIQSFAYIEFENDRAIRMIGVNWDMTKEKLAEIQLEESLKKFENLYNNSPVMLYSFDRNGVILSVSNFWLRSMGYQRNEVIGKKTTEFLTPKSRKFANDYVLPKFFKTGSVNFVNYELVRKNGDIIEAELSAISERDDEGNIINSLAVMIDVTERNKAQKESEYKTKRVIEFRKALDAAAFVVFTNEKGVVKYVNNNFCNLLNKEPIELNGTSFIDLINISESKFNSEVFNDAILKSNIWHGEIKFKNNDIAWLQVTAIPIYDELTNSKEVLIISFEITRLIQAENKLINLNRTLEDRVKERTAELINLNKEKDNILSMVSHDLKNPLTGIILASDIIKLQSEKNDDTKIMEVAEKIAKTSYKMIDIIKNLLELNAVESGKIQTNFSYVNVAQLIENCINESKINADRKNQTIHYSIPEQEYAVYIDKKLIVQVLDNLISNAIKFTHKNKNIWVELKAESEYYSISIRDEGVGISDEDKPKLFQKFTKLSSKPTDGEDSTGLGLSIVKQFVELMNGTIAVKSKNNEGTTFIITFNRHQVNL